MYSLEAALADYRADDTTEAFWTALWNVAETQGGIGKLAERRKINPLICLTCVLQGIIDERFTQVDSVISQLH